MRRLSIVKYILGAAACATGMVAGYLSGNRWELAWAGIALAWMTSAALYEQGAV